MSEWKTYKFNKAVEVNPKVEIKNRTGLPFVEMKDVEPTNKFCTYSQLRDLGGGARFTNGDTLFARITPCLENGKIAQVRNLPDNVGFGSTEFHVLRGKKDITTSEFVYYLSRWDDVRDFAELNLHGTSGRQRFPAEAFGELEILIPPLPQQQSIAEVLSSLDDKIDLLHQQNKTLEALAETLFKQWFVEERDLSWPLLRLDESIVIKRGGSPRPIQDYISPTGLSWLKISDVTSLNTPYVFDIKEKIKETGLSKTVFLKSGSLVLSNSATPGVPKILQTDTCIHDGWLYFPKSKFSVEFLYLLFKYIREDLIQRGNGSIFTNLKTDILKEFILPTPNKEVLDLFQEKIVSFFQKMLNNTQQINQLETLRNNLLPKLMSGAVTVSSQ